MAKARVQFQAYSFTFVDVEVPDHVPVNERADWALRQAKEAMNPWEFNWSLDETSVAPVDDEPVEFMS